MRLVSIVLAILLGTGIYLGVVERERTAAFLAAQFGDVSGEETTVAEGSDTQSVSLIEELADKTLADATETSGAIRVVVRRSTAREIDSAVILRGQSEAVRSVDVRSETSSTVISEPIRKGAFVEAGELLCRLDPGTRPASLAEARAQLAGAVSRKTEAEARVPEAEARVAEALARLAEAEVNQNAASRLSEGGFASETRVRNTEAAVAAAQASLEASRASVTAARSGLESADATIESAAAAVALADKEISRLELRAPFDGLLESDTAEIGSLLQTGSICATIIQLDPIKLVAFVPETEVNRVEVGAIARAELAAGGGDVTGAVTFLSRAADPTTRTFRVEIEIPNSDLTIRDGQTAEIAISAAGAQAHLLPPSALTLNQDGVLGLRLVDVENRVAFAPVIVLRDTAQGIWLTGLPPEINVIVVGQEFVTAGIEVAPTFEEQTQ